MRRQRQGRARPARRGLARDARHLNGASVVKHQPKTSDTSGVQPSVSRQAWSNMVGGQQRGNDVWVDATRERWECE
jgi:hypothetical protein